MSDQEQKKVIVYSGAGWPACTQVKGFLSQQGVEYEVRDIQEDESAQNELVSMGFTAIPVTVIDGVPILGPDLKKIEGALGTWSQWEFMKWSTRSLLLCP